MLYHDCSYDIPQDYIYHQQVLLQNAIRYEQNFYYDDLPTETLLYKTIILVDDLLMNSDTMLACLRSLRKQRPLKIVVAVPIVAAEAALAIRSEADDMVFIKMQTRINLANDFFTEFPKVDRESVRELLLKSKRKSESIER